MQRGMRDAYCYLRHKCAAQHWPFAFTAADKTCAPFPTCPLHTPHTGLLYRYYRHKLQQLSTAVQAAEEQEEGEDEAMQLGEGEEDLGIGGSGRLQELGWDQGRLRDVAAYLRMLGLEVGGAGGWGVSERGCGAVCGLLLPPVPTPAALAPALCTAFSSPRLVTSNPNLPLPPTRLCRRRRMLRWCAATCGSTWRPAPPAPLMNAS